MFGKVAGASDTAPFHNMNITLIGKTPLDTTYDTINQIVFNPVRINVVANDAQLPGITLPPEPGIADALKACQQYMVTH